MFLSTMSITVCVKVNKVNLSDCYYVGETRKEDFRPGGNAGGPTEDLVEYHPGGHRASWRTSCLWPATLEPGVAGGPGPPCMVRDREGCRQHIGGRSDPTRMIAALVTEQTNRPLPDISKQFAMDVRRLN